MRWTPTLLLAVVALAVGGLVVADLRAPSSAGERPAAVVAGPAVGGAWYCAAGGTGETEELSVVTAAPPSSSSPADTEVRSLTGEPAILDNRPVFPGSARGADVTVDAPDQGGVGVAVRWWDQPIATGRVWRISGQGTGGFVSGPCASSPSPTWYVPGLSTAGGSTAQLHLANPFGSDASVSIRFTTPAGPEAPILLENVSVSASSVAVVDLGEHIPRQPDVGVAVEVRSGRVVVEAVQRLDAAIGGVDAVALVRAAPRLSETWTIPWSLTDPTEDVLEQDPDAPVDDGVGEDEGIDGLDDDGELGTEPPPTDTAPTEEEVSTEALLAPADLTTTEAPQPTETDPDPDTDATVDDEVTPDEDETPDAEDPTETPTEVPGTSPAAVRTASPGAGTASWIWVSNPGEEAAAVTVTLHTADGPVVPDIGDELLVDAGQVLRVDLRGLLPPGQSAAGATVRSENGIPVVAGIASLMAPEIGDPDQTGYTAQLGWPSGDTDWVVPGEQVEDREQVLHLVNPGADVARVDVAVWDGAALRRPADLQQVEVAPGALVELDVTSTVSGAAGMVAYVSTTEGVVVAGRHSVGEEVADWVAHTGVPAGLWSGGGAVLPVDHDPQLIERLGTTGGLPVLEPGEVEPSPSPTPMPTEPVTTEPVTTEPEPATPAPTEPSPTDEAS